MTVVFEQQRAWDIELYNVGQEKLKEGRQEERENLIKKMLKMATPLDISMLTGIPQDEIERIAESLN